MGMLYVAALVFGLGTILVQLLVSAGGDGDAAHGADAGGGSDAGPAEVEGGDATQGQEAIEVHSADGATAEFVGIVLSLRFWTFGGLAFGLLGVILHYLDLAGRGTTLALSIALGLVSGTGASWSFRALARSSTGMGADSTEVLGQVGRMVVPCGPGSRGKVRLSLRGQTVDYVATTDDSELQSGERVIVEELRGPGVHVARIPPDRELGNG